jgi:tetratricopeptide (TPR) repeat protein
MMKYAIFLAALTACNAQSISGLTAEIQRTPTAALYVQRASAYLTTGDARAALADADRALDRDALNVRALTVRSQANTKLGRFSTTVADLSGAIALAPGDASLYMARAEAYAAVGDQPRALADRNEALRLDPNIASAPPSSNVAATPPVVVTTPAVPTPPVTPAPAPAKTVVNIPPALPAPVAPSAKAPAATTPTTVATADAHYQQAKKLLDEKKTAEAIAELDAAIQLNSTNPVLFNTRGYAYYLTKEIKRALQDYDEAIKLNPEYINATHNRALARKSAGDAAGAEADRKREAELSKKR